MKFFTKKLVVPETTETKQVDAVQLWTVTWWARVGKWDGEREKQYEAFTSQEAADEFAESLRAAFRLIRCKDRTDVDVNMN
jgi:hypothetical protein